jgi:imidazolonepropionase-like amidohydrolase
VASPGEAEAFVLARKSGGADYLKIILNGVRTATSRIPNMTEDTATALVRAAHAREMLVVAHVESLDDVRVALASGVDGLAHLWREDGPANDLRLQPFLTPAVKQRLNRPPAGAVLPNINWRLAAIGRLHVSGARLLTGTDADDGARSASGVHMHRELELLVKSGSLDT